MGFVESVLGEFGAGVEHGVGQFFGDVVGDGTLDEGFALGVHFGFDFLAHGTAQKIGLGQGVACHVAGGLLHLFLIGDDAEGFFQNRLKDGMEIDHLFLAEFAGAV